MRRLIQLVLCLAFPVAVMAAEPVAGERQKLAEEYFRAAGYEDMYTNPATIEQMLQAQMQSMEAGMRSRMTEAQARDLHQFLVELGPDLKALVAASMMRVKPEMIAVLADAYSADELRALLGFYNSAVGRQVVAKNPQLVNGIATVSGKHTGEMLQDLQHLIVNRLQARSQAAPAPASKPAKGK